MKKLFYHLIFFMFCFLSMTVSVWAMEPSDEPEATTAVETTREAETTTAPETTTTAEETTTAPEEETTTKEPETEPPLIHTPGKTRLSVSVSTYGSQVYLRWSKATHANRYRISYVINGKRTTKVVSSLSYTIHTTKDTIVEGIRMRPINTQGDISKYGEAVCAGNYSTFVLSRPTLSLKAYRNRYVKLSWAKIPNATHYVIYRSLDGGKTYQRIATTKSCSYTNIHTRFNSAMHYKVRASRCNVEKNLRRGSFSSSKAITLPKSKVRYTLAQYFHFSSQTLVNHLTAHSHDHYYLSTPYIGVSPYYSWVNAQRPAGSGRKTIFGKYGMNCTGFVSYALKKCGADTKRVSAGNVLPIGNPDFGYDSNAYNWQLFTESHPIEYYNFYSISSLLKSGLARKGDVILTIPLLGGDWHMGFFWGATSSSKVFWNSDFPNNRMTRIYGLSALNIYRLIKVR